MNIAVAAIAVFIAIMFVGYPLLSAFTPKTRSLEQIIMMDEAMAASLFVSDDENDRADAFTWLVFRGGGVRSSHLAEAVVVCMIRYGESHDQETWRIYEAHYDRITQYLGRGVVTVFRQPDAFGVDISSDSADRVLRISAARWGVDPDREPEVLRAILDEE